MYFIYISIVYRYTLWLGDHDTGDYDLLAIMT